MTRRGVFGAIGGAIASLFVGGKAGATWFERRRNEKMRDPEFAAAYQKEAEIITARSLNGRRTQLFYEGKLEGRACAACPKEGWFERFALEDDHERKTFVSGGRGAIDRGRAGGIKVRNGDLVKERVYGAFYLKDRVTGVVTHVVP